MIITEKQLLVFLQTAMDSLCIAGAPFNYDLETRRKVVDDFVNQQKGTLKAEEPEA